MMRLTADNIKIDDDEGRFILVISTEEIGNITVDFHACALEFEDEVRKQLRPYALEAADARRAVAAGVSLKSYVGAAEDDDCGYALDDPKHPTYYERMVG